MRNSGLNTLQDLEGLCEDNEFQYTKVRFSSVIKKGGNHE